MGIHFSSVMAGPVPAIYALLCSEGHKGVDARHKAGPDESGVWRYRMVGMVNSAPSLVPEGQRDVIVLVLV